MKKVYTFLTPTKTCTRIDYVRIMADV